MTPRPYQSEALAALHQHLASSPNVAPCVVLPTGAGKSPFMAWAIQDYISSYPPFRCVVLAHVQELISQNAQKLLDIWPDAPVGVYSAGLKSREMLAPITFAGIQSVFDKALDFAPWDLIFVDEAHRIPLKGEGMYRKFLKDARMNNPRVVLCGVTATAMRLDGGPICHPKHLLHKVIYEANVKTLIDQGYLCGLRSKVGDVQPDRSTLHVRNGEFVTGEAEAAVSGLVPAAIEEALSLAHDRRAIIFFCVTVKHAHDVSEELERRGVHAPVIHAKTPKDQRAQLVQSFVGGQLRAICNVNVLSEGFDARHVDCIVMLRPTKSKGLYYQQVGRSLRTHPSKEDALILDFAGNIEEHGPIDTLNPGRVELQRCPRCKESFPRAAEECPDCGWFETVQCERCGHEERADYVRCSKCGNLLKFKVCTCCEARNEPGVDVCQFCLKPFQNSAPRSINHAAKASDQSILSDGAAAWWFLAVDSVDVEEHRKRGDESAPPTLQVTYRGKSEGGNLARVGESVKEWVCLEHGGYAGQKARAWWLARFPTDPPPESVAEALGRDLFLGQTLTHLTESVQVGREGKYNRVLGVKLRKNASAMVER